MKKILLLLLLTFNLVNAQDTIRLKHTNYTTIYSKSLHYPVLVEWWETKSKSECKGKLDRVNNFAPDPLLKVETNIDNDYLVGNREQKLEKLKGFDRGHMCPARVNQCLGQQVQTECFYFSNMAAQYHALNGGDWKTLETLTFDTSIAKDSVHVWAGSIGVAKKIGTTSVPTKCWKVIYVKKTNEWSAYLFNNDTSKANGLEDNKVKLEVIEELTGFKFKKK